jgi:hypothetical protein
MEKLKNEELLARYYSGVNQEKFQRKFEHNWLSLCQKNREHRAGSPAHTTSSKNWDRGKNYRKNPETSYSNLNHRRRRI